MSTLNSAHAPNSKTMLVVCQELFKSKGEDAVYEYLQECASNDFKCPDKCDSWAMDFYEDHADEIEGRE